MKSSNAYFHGQKYEVNVDLADQQQINTLREQNEARIVEEAKEVFMLSPLGCDQYLNTDSYH